MLGAADSSNRYDNVFLLPLQIFVWGGGRDENRTPKSTLEESTSDLARPCPTPPSTVSICIAEIYTVISIITRHAMKPHI